MHEENWRKTLLDWLRFCANSVNFELEVVLRFGCVGLGEETGCGYELFLRGRDS
jgi:hypothetical protein